jgi:hypothetical protein
VTSRGMRPTLDSAENTISSQDPPSLFVPVYCVLCTVESYLSLPSVGRSVRKRLQWTYPRLRTF